MGKRLGMLACGLAAGLLSALITSPQARAQQTQTVICSDQPNGPTSYQLVLDHVSMRVQLFGQWHSASFSAELIQWNTPRYEPGTGEIRLARRYYLNRVDGTLRGDPAECQPRDMSYCHVIQSYCRAGQRVF